MKAAVLSRWNGPGCATPSARSTAWVSSRPRCSSAPAGKMSAGAYTSIMGTAVLLLLVMMLVIGTLDYDDHHSQGGEMAAGVRERMVAGAVRLLAQHGLQATSFSTVLATTKAPRGSIYHHFPGGKDELVTAAIGSAEQHALALLDQQVGASAVAVAESFLGAWRTLLTRAGYEIGCALVAVTVAAESPELRERTASAFGAWRQKLASALLAGGLAEADADAAAA